MSAKGELVAFLDSDVILDKNYYKTLINYFERFDDLIAIQGVDHSLIESQMQIKKLNKFNIPNNAINIYGNHPAKSALLSSNRSCYLLCTTEKKFDYWNNFVISNKINIKKV